MGPRLLPLVGKVRSPSTTPELTAHYEVFSVGTYSLSLWATMSTSGSLS
jgi:hypothetical protein